MHETVYKSKISVSVKVVLLIKYLIENRVEMYVIFNFFPIHNGYFRKYLCICATFVTRVFCQSYELTQILECDNYD